MDLDEFLKNLDIHNMEQDMMFSDLEDDDDNVVRRNSGETRTENCNVPNENENSTSKSVKTQKKKAAMNYSIKTNDIE